jgi:hypothetical protein
MEDVQYTCHFSKSILFLGKVAICTTSIKPKKEIRTLYKFQTPVGIRGFGGVSE